MTKKQRSLTVHFAKCAAIHPSYLCRHHLPSAPVSYARVPLAFRGQGPASPVGRRGLPRQQCRGAAAAGPRAAPQPRTCRRPGAGAARALRRHHVPGRGAAAGPGRATPPPAPQRQRSPAQRIPLAHARCLLRAAPWLRSDGASAGEQQGEEPGMDGAAGSEQKQGQANRVLPPPWGGGGGAGICLPLPRWWKEEGTSERFLTGCPFPSRSRGRSWKRRCPAAASPAWSFGRSRRYLPLPNRPFRKRKAGSSTRPVPPRAPAGLSAATASAQVPQRDPPQPRGLWGARCAPHGHPWGFAVIPAAASVCRAPIEPAGATRFTDEKGQPLIFPGKSSICSFNMCL